MDPVTWWVSSMSPGQTIRSRRQRMRHRLRGVAGRDDSPVVILLLEKQNRSLCLVLSAIGIWAVWARRATTFVRPDKGGNEGLEFRRGAMTEFEEVSIKVPADRVAEFYEWFGQWSSETDRVFVPVNQLAPPQDGQWDPEKDVALARGVLGDVSAGCKELVAVLTDHHGTPVPWRNLAVRCGVEGARSVAQLVAELAATAHSRRRQVPALWIDAGDGSAYWIERDHIRLWMEALEDPKMPTQSSAPEGLKEQKVDGIEGR